MKKQELCKKYNIPEKIINEYEVLTKKDGTVYNDDDLEKLSIIMTLCDAGFSEAEIKSYMKPCADKKELIAMLNAKRESTLDEIHFKEKQIANIDCLMYKIRNGGI